MSSLKRTVEAQASLQQQFDEHQCGPKDSSQAAARVSADVLLRQEPDEDEAEDEDDRKKKDDDDHDDNDDGYSE